MEIKPDPNIYTEQSESLMTQRGILRGDETMRGALERATTALLDMDAELAGGIDYAFQDTTARLINNGTIVYGTPVLTNAGREAEMTAACTVLPIRVNNGQVDVKRFTTDSYGALDKAVGTGYDLSSVEEPAVALLELNEALDGINVNLLERNKRPVASMATLRADHPKVVDFIRAKRDADFSKWRFNLSLFVTEELFSAARAGKPWELHDESGVVTGQIDANELLAEIADCAHYCGEPGILFKDRIDADNPTPQWEYKSTAPCAEVAMAAGEACQFSYINVASLGFRDGFNEEEFGLAVRTMTRLLDASVEYTIRNNGDLPLPLVEQKRRVGVGITGFADMLMKMRVPYDDPRALDMAATISELLDYHSKVASTQLARERGPFPSYPVSRYLEPEWLRRKLPRSTGAVSEAAWTTLMNDIERFGVRNASTTSMPPTGTSSAIVGSSKSLEPHFDLASHTGIVHRVVNEVLQEERDPEVVQMLLGAISINPQSVLDGAFLEQFPHLKTARQISPSYHLKIQASFQSFLDEAMAKTINLPEQATANDVLSSLWKAYDYNLKGITVFRDNCLGQREKKN